MAFCGNATKPARSLAASSRVRSPTGATGPFFLRQRAKPRREIRGDRDQAPAGRLGFCGGHFDVFPLEVDFRTNRAFPLPPPAGRQKARSSPTGKVSSPHAERSAPACFGVRMAAGLSISRSLLRFPSPHLRCSSRAFHRMKRASGDRGGRCCACRVKVSESGSSLSLNLASHSSNSFALKLATDRLGNVAAKRSRRKRRSLW